MLREVESGRRRNVGRCVAVMLVGFGAKKSAQTYPQCLELEFCISNNKDKVPKNPVGRYFGSVSTEYTLTSIFDLDAFLALGTKENASGLFLVFVSSACLQRARGNLLLSMELPEEWCCTDTERPHHIHVVIKDMMHVYIRCRDMVGKWGQKKVKDFVRFLCFQARSEGMGHAFPFSSHQRMITCFSGDSTWATQVYMWELTGTECTFLSLHGEGEHIL